MRIWILVSILLLILGCVTTPITGSRKFIVTSESQENALGQQSYQQILAKERISTDRRWTEILNRVGRRISQVANKPDYKWEFKLIESKEMNAFALPGGKVAFYTGILPVCQNEAGLATVMGHEVAHATARHGGQRITTALGTQIGLIGVSVALGKPDSPKTKMIMAALGLGLMVGVNLPFSRGNEAEADEIGLVYMSQAGYDPREAPKFWGRFATKGSSVPTFLSTHPNSKDRMDDLNAQLPQVIPLYEGSPKYGAGETL